MIILKVVEDYFMAMYNERILANMHMVYNPDVKKLVKKEHIYWKHIYNVFNCNKEKLSRGKSSQGLLTFYVLFLL